MTTSANMNGVEQSSRRHGSFQSQHSSGASLKGCCCCLFLLITFLALLVLAVVLIIALAVKPKKPQFDLQQVAVQYVGIMPAPEGSTTTTTTTSASLSLNIKMLFTARNPNKVGLKYGESRFYVMYRGVPLGVATVPGFYQPANSVRQVETMVAVDRINLLQADAADLVKDASLNDRVELRMTGDVGAKIRILGFTSPRVQANEQGRLPVLILSMKECNNARRPAIKCKEWLQPLLEVNMNFPQPFSFRDYQL